MIFLNFRFRFVRVYKDQPREELGRLVHVHRHKYNIHVLHKGEYDVTTPITDWGMYGTPN